MRITPDGLEPDWPTQIKGLQMLLAYRDGLPIQRIEEIPKREISFTDLKQSFLTKPGYRHAVIGYLESLKREVAEISQRESEPGDPACPS